MYGLLLAIDDAGTLTNNEIDDIEVKIKDEVISKISQKELKSLNDQQAQIDLSTGFVWVGLGLRLIQRAEDLKITARKASAGTAVDIHVFLFEY